MDDQKAIQALDVDELKQVTGGTADKGYYIPCTHPDGHLWVESGKFLRCEHCGAVQCKDVEVQHP